MIAALVAVLVPLAASAEEPDPGVDRSVARFQRQLERSGYISQSGTEGVFDLSRRYCEGVIFTAFWPNPLTPYVVSGIPEVPGQAPSTNAPATWRLRQDEAIVMIGITPPPEAYFSFDLTNLRGSLATGPVLWASVGDPINNETVRTKGATPYDQPFALVLTGNRRTQAEVDRMLAVAGLRGMTNDVTIPPAMFRLGLDEGSDEFLLGLRTALPEPGFEQALDDYRAAPPLQVFRVRPTSSSADETEPVYPPDPLPVPRLRVSGTGTTELDLQPTLELLRQRIIDKYPAFEAHDVVLERGFEESYPGLQADLETDPPIQGVAGATNDADYVMGLSFSLPDGAFLVAYGTSHVATGKAVYTSVSLYADAVATVPLATKQSAELKGSARDFIDDQPNSGKFYAWAFSRAGDSGPSGPHVTIVPATDAEFCAQYGTDRPVDTSTIQVLTRTYMEPATLTRPALSELLLDRVLLFTPKA
jgi:hypothetical protein